MRRDAQSAPQNATSVFGGPRRARQMAGVLGRRVERPILNPSLNKPTPCPSLGGEHDDGDLEMGISRTRQPRGSVRCKV